MKRGLAHVLLGLGLLQACSATMHDVTGGKAAYEPTRSSVALRGRGIKAYATRIVDGLSLAHAQASQSGLTSPSSRCALDEADPESWLACWLRELAERADDAGPLRVLDIGSGSGRALRELQQLAAKNSLVDLETFALEPAPVAFEDSPTPPREGSPEANLLRETLQPYRINLPLSAMEAADFPGYFDVIFAVDVVQYVPNVVAELAKAQAWLKPGGWLFVSSTPALHTLIAESSARRAASSRLRRFGTNRWRLQDSQQPLDAVQLSWLETVRAAGGIALPHADTLAQDSQVPRLFLALPGRESIAVHHLQFKGSIELEARHAFTYHLSLYQVADP